MSETLVVSPGQPLRGEVGGKSLLRLPGDKSISHRAALFSALAEGESEINNFQISGVTQVMLEALNKLSVGWKLTGTTLHVEGKNLISGGMGKKGIEEITINCGNSATTMRLLAGALSAWGIPARLDGTPGLKRRPMQRIIEPLSRMGVNIDSKEGYAPLRIHPGKRPLRAIDYHMAIASAQVKSCLLLAGLMADGMTIVREPAASRDHTERMLRNMGAAIKSNEIPVNREDDSDFNSIYVTELIPNLQENLRPLKIVIPGDFSAASFLIVAALIVPGSEIIIREVGLNPTRIGLLETLIQMGAIISINNTSENQNEPIGDIKVRHSELHSGEVSGSTVVRMIDEFPVFSMAAAYAKGLTRVRDAIELRRKESDRIKTLCQEMTKLEVNIVETPDGFEIQGGKTPSANVVYSHGDHRLAMSLAIAGLAAQATVRIEQAEIIRESFPDFVPVLQGLGANIESGLVIDKQ